MSNRVEWEDGNAVPDDLGDEAAELAFPGVFSGGKMIDATQHTAPTSTSPRILRFRFSDGSEMNLVGDFEVRYKHAGPAGRGLVEKGNELMSGKFPGAVANPVEPPTVEGTDVTTDTAS